MSIRFRKAIPLGPFLRANLSRGGVSWTVHFGPWSWNTRTRRNRVDLPGPLSWEQDRERGEQGSAWPLAVALVLTAALAVGVVLGGMWLWTHATDLVAAAGADR